jgi:hypothetical protein
VTRPATLRRRQQQIAEFAAGLVRLLDVVAPDGGSFSGYPSWAPQQGYAQEAGRRAAEVDRFAGGAALALSSVGAIIEWKPRGTMQTRPINPASAWRTILDGDPMFPPDMILSVCNQAIGALDAVATEAEEREASLGRKLARVLPGSRGRKGDGHGILVAIVVTVAGGLIVTYLAFRLGWTATN